MCSVTFDWEENDAMRKVAKFEKTRGNGFFGSLLWATVEFTEVCNHRCIYCYENAGSNYGQKKEFMPREKMESLINYFSEQGIRQLTCSGGEPLMYPHITDAVRLAKDNGMVVHMITNGYFLSRQRARKLYNAGLTQVQINIDSVDPKKHDRIRGKKGSFEHAIKALNNAREAGMTCVTQTVMIKDNEDEVMDIFRLARSMDIQRCRVWDIVPSEGRAFSNMHLKPTRNYIDTLYKLAQFARNTGAMNIESGDPLFPNGVDTGMHVTGGFCPYSIGLLTNLSVNGDAYFCCTNRDKAMYNAFDAMKQQESFREIHMKALKAFMERMQLYNLPDECRLCSRFITCKGGCYMRRRFVDHGRDYWCEGGHNEIKPAEASISINPSDEKVGQTIAA